MISKPQSDEYGSYHSTYISKVSEGDVLALLEQLKETTANFFISVGKDKANYAYAEGKWTIKEVLGHLIDQERIFGYRALCFSKESIELPGYDQDLYVNNSNSNNRTIQNLVAEFKALRESNLFLFSSFSDEQLLRKGIASGYKVSVRALIYIIAGHELHHLGIIKERYL
jgi:uncharacterized damage-inducible protein DinB